MSDNDFSAADVRTVKAAIAALASITQRVEQDTIVQHHIMGKVFLKALLADGEHVRGAQSTVAQQFGLDRTTVVRAAALAFYNTTPVAAKKGLAAYGGPLNEYEAALAVAFRNSEVKPKVAKTAKEQGLDALRRLRKADYFSALPRDLQREIKIALG